MFIRIRRLLLPLAAALALTVTLAGGVSASSDPNGANRDHASCLAILTSFGHDFNYSVSDSVHAIQAAAAAGDTNSGQIISMLAQSRPTDPSEGWHECYALLLPYGFPPVP